MEGEARNVLCAEGATINQLRSAGGLNSLKQLTELASAKRLLTKSAINGRVAMREAHCHPPVCNLLICEANQQVAIAHERRRPKRILIIGA